MFPPPRPIIRTIDTENLDSLDAQKTATKEAPKRKRATMEEIKKLEKELIKAKERNMRCNLRWHNEVQAEKAKMVTLEQQMALIAKKASGSVTQEKDVPLEEQYVLGGEEELVFARPTPSTYIRNLQEIERKEKTRHGDVTRRQEHG